MIRAMEHHFGPLVTKEHFDYMLSSVLVGGAITIPAVTDLNQYLLLIGGLLGVALAAVRLYKAIWTQNG